jgi:hypothetical protein
MKYAYSILLLLVAFTVLTGSKCKTVATPTPEFYFKCKVDGKEYIPNKCANCLVPKILKDTIFILRANKGYETLGVGINDRTQIKVTSYTLNEVVGQMGDYKFSTTTNDRFFTDASHLGELKITFLDKDNKVVEGSFHFRAFNSLTNAEVTISEGAFRLNYKTD